MDSLRLLPGLVHLLRRSGQRWLGLMYLLFLALMIAMGAKDYYVTPIYPILFAVGGVAWEKRFARRQWVQLNRIFAFPAISAVSTLLAVILLPLSNPVVRPTTFQQYRAALHLPDTETEAHSVAPPLPQFYSDRFGWQEEVDTVTKIVQQLLAQDRAHVAILCSNYGEAGALEFLGHDLPPILSGHNTYWLWGIHGVSGQVLIDISGESAGHLRLYYREVTIVGRMGTTWSMLRTSQHLPAARPALRHHGPALAAGKRLHLAVILSEAKDPDTLKNQQDTSNPSYDVAAHAARLCSIEARSEGCSPS